MSEDQFTKLFSAVNQRIDRLYDAVNIVLKNQENEQQERLAMNRQLDRHEEWLVRVALQLEIYHDPGS